MFFFSLKFKFINFNNTFKEGIKCFSFESVVKIMSQIHFCAGSFALIQLNLKENIKQVQVLVNLLFCLHIYYMYKSCIFCNHYALKEYCLREQLRSGWLWLFCVYPIWLRRHGQPKKFESKCTQLCFEYILIKWARTILSFSHTGNLIGSSEKMCTADSGDNSWEMAEIQSKQ